MCRKIVFSWYFLFSKYRHMCHVKLQNTISQRQNKIFGYLVVVNCFLRRGIVLSNSINRLTYIYKCIEDPLRCNIEATREILISDSNSVHWKRLEKYILVSGNNPSNFVGMDKWIIPLLSTKILHITLSYTIRYR